MLEFKRKLVIKAPTPGCKARLVRVGNNNYRIKIETPKGIVPQVITPIVIEYETRPYKKSYR